MSTRRHPAFTLVELLVVIGILAVLLAILLPTFSKAREQGNRVACLSNLKQLGHAIIMYTGNNRGWFPRAADSGIAADDWIFWQSGRNLDQGVLVPYLGGTFVEKNYRCPSDDVTLHPQYPYSYTMNEFMGGLKPVSGMSTVHTRIRITQVQRPAEKLVFIEESGQTCIDGCWAPQHYPTDKYNLLSNRHSKLSEDRNDINAGNGNALFCDGHADFIERKLAQDPLYYDPAK